MYILYETFLYCISWLTVLSWVSCIYLNLFAKASARNAQALQMHLKSGRHRLLSNKFLSHVNTFFNPLWLHTALSKEKNVTVPLHTHSPFYVFSWKKSRNLGSFYFSVTRLPPVQIFQYCNLSRSLSLPPPPPWHYTVMYIPVHSLFYQLYQYALCVYNVRVHDIELEHEAWSGSPKCIISDPPSIPFSQTPNP
jgi:hypothetical protein